MAKISKKELPINTLEMEIALMKYLGIRQNLVVPNVSWGMDRLHECDILSLSNSNYATEIEIKISKGDLLKDKEKNHRHEHYLITNFYYAVPKKLVELALTEIPERAGLICVEKIENRGKMYLQAYEIKKTKRKGNAYKWNDDDRNRLARLGTLRILGLKEKIYKLKCKN